MQLKNEPLLTAGEKHLLFCLSMLFFLTPRNKHLFEDSFRQKSHYLYQRGFLLKECFCLIYIKRSAVFRLEMGLYSTNGEKSKWCEHYSLTLGVRINMILRKLDTIV